LIIFGYGMVEAGVRWWEVACVGKMTMEEVKNVFSLAIDVSLLWWYVSKNPG